MITDGKQVKVVLPGTMYQHLRSEADAAGVTIADLVRLALREHYRSSAGDLSFDGDLRSVVAAYTAGELSAQSVADRVVTLVQEGA